MIVCFWLWYVVSRNTVRFGSTIHTLLKVAEDKGTLGMLVFFLGGAKQLIGAPIQGSMPDGSRLLSCLEVWALGFERRGLEFGGLVGF